MKSKLTEVLLKTFPWLRKKSKGTFIECGANDGKFINTCHWFEINNEWHGINIECNPYCFVALKKNRPNCLNLKYALSDTDDQEVEFMLPLNESDNKQKMTGRGSIVFKHKWQIWNTLKKGELRLEKHKVQTITYKTLIERYNIKGVDLFVLDIESNELAALRGIKNCPVLPKIFCIETNQVGRNKTFEILEPYGYQISGHFQADTFFIKT
jgi:FkbM family methyltransferase